ncbi:40842_t:CDS:2, partial [Gigaspora margarita]
MTSVEEISIFITKTYSTNAFNILEVTHVVIGIKWGAVIIASFENENTNKSNRTQVHGELKAHLEGMSLISVGDIIPDTSPQSFEDVRELLSKLQSYIQTYNDGKGIPDREVKSRRELSKCLINTRSGKSETSITSFINKYESMSMKADLLPIPKARGRDYLNKNITIQQILLEHPKSHIYILFDTDNYIINIDSPVWNAILDISSINKGSSKFFIVDPTLYRVTDRPNYSVIHYYINGRQNSSDYYNDKKKVILLDDAISGDLDALIISSEVESV